MDNTLNVDINARTSGLDSGAERAANSVRSFARNVADASRTASVASRGMQQAYSSASGEIARDSSGTSSAVDRMGGKVRSALNATKGVMREFALGMRDGFRQAIQESNNAAATFERNANKGKGGGIKGGGGGVGGLVAGVVTAAAGAGIVDTIKEYERLGAVLTTLEGSSDKAAKTFSEIKQFAATTPSQLSDVVRGFSTLKSRGLDAGIPALQSYGNTASAMGKSLQQMIEAVADASTGEFERLKEFGIQGKKNGDEVSLTFDGVTTNLKNNSKDIEAYLQKIGNTKFAGAMARESATLGGAISNVQDVVAGTAAALGAGGLSKALQTVLVDIAGVGSSSESAAMAIGKGMGEAVLFLWDGFKNLITAAQPIVEVFRGMVQAFQPVAAVMFDVGKSFAAAIGPIVLSAVKILGPEIAKLAPPIAAMFKTLGELSVALVKALGPTAIQIVKGFFNVVGPVISGIAAIVTSLAKAVTLALRGDFLGAFVEVGRSIGGIVGTIVGFIKNMIVESVKVLGSFASIFVQIGANMINGIIQGISQRIGSAVNTVRSLGTMVANSFKEVLQIRSPSVVFRQFGEFIADGLIEGIKRKTPAATEAAKDLANALKSLFTRYLTEGETANQQYLEDLDLIKRGLKDGAISANLYADALKRINEENAIAIRAGIAKDIGKGKDLVIRPSRDLTDTPNDVRGGSRQYLNNAGQDVDTFANKVRASFMPLQDMTAQLFENMITGASSWRDIVSQAALAIVRNLSQAGAEIATNWLKTELFKTQVSTAANATRTGVESAANATSLAQSVAIAIKKGAIYAWTAAQATYASIAAIPVIGPILAPVMALAAFAGVVALGRNILSAKGGMGQIPSDGTLVETHKDEMILPAWIASPFRAMLKSQGGVPSVGMAASFAGAAGGSARAADVASRNELVDRTAMMQQSGSRGGTTINAIDAKSIKKLFEDNAGYTKRGLKRLARDLED
jgi:hypothetical protein